MAVIGVHALIYTPEAEALRAALADAIGWSHVDAGEGELHRKLVAVRARARTAVPVPASAEEGIGGPALF